MIKESWAKRNPEKMREYRRRYNEKNREKINEKARVRYQQDTEMRERMREYYRGRPRPDKKAIKTCEGCGEEKLVPKNGKYCSRDCFFMVNKGSNHPNWKGDSVGYTSLHDWVRRQLGDADNCQHCKTEKAKKYEWANISKDYKRDLQDWVSLCKSCHVKYDGVLAKGWKTRKLCLL